MAGELCHAFGLASDEVVGQSALVDTLPLAPATVLAYLAGFIDGEGCIRINRRQPRAGEVSDIYQVHVEAEQVSRDPLDLLSRTYGGSVTVNRRNSRANANWQDTYRWQLYAFQAVRCIQDLLPYLRGKRPQAEVCLRFAAMTRSRTGGPGGSRPRDARVTGQMERLFQECRALNLRGGEAVRNKLEQIL